MTYIPPGPPLLRCDFCLGAQSYDEATIGDEHCTWVWLVDIRDSELDTSGSHWCSRACFRRWVANGCQPAEDAYEHLLGTSGRLDRETAALCLQVEA